MNYYISMLSRHAELGSASKETLTAATLNDKKSGFTLVELAIALMVIGLLIGGVLKGQELIENAKALSLVRQIKSYDTATIIFRNMYGSLPGDLKNPSSRIPSCTSQICSIPGNANGKILHSDTPGPYMEVGNFFPHLTKTNLIHQGPPGGTMADALALFGHFTVNDERKAKFLPMTPINLYVAVQHSDSAAFSNANFATKAEKPGHYYELFWPDAASAPPVKMLISIDKKIDDGKPFTGSMGLADIGTGCPVNNASLAPSLVEYDITYNSATACILVFAAAF